MDEISSSEFRRRYATLTEPVVVVVNGRPIGQYIPATTSVLYVDPTPTYAGLTSPPGTRNLATETAHFDIDTPGMDSRFRSRPFTPVPKKGK